MAFKIFRPFGAQSLHDDSRKVIRKGSGDSSPVNRGHHRGARALAVDRLRSLEQKSSALATLVVNAPARKPSLGAGASVRGTCLDDENLRGTHQSAASTIRQLPGI